MDKKSSFKYDEKNRYYIRISKKVKCWDNISALSLYKIMCLNWFLINKLSFFYLFGLLEHFSITLFMISVVEYHFCILSGNSLSSQKALE